MTLYLQDMPVGLRLSSGTYALDVERIKGFAQEFDPQPFHLDEAAAEQSFFGGLAASGWHTAAITMRLITSLQPAIAGGIIGAGAQLDWPTATRPGDVLRVECEVIEARPLRSRPDRGLVLMHIRTLNQHDEVRQDLKAKLIVFQRP
jgi:acyl dehydratase